MNELASLIEEIKADKLSALSLAHHLLVNERRQKPTTNMLRDCFDDAREAAQIPKAERQFRVMGATAATNSDDTSSIKDVQAFLGRTTAAMTAKYIGHEVGRKAKPAT